MSEVRAATVLALWGAAYRAGLAAPDTVLEHLSGAGRSAGVRAADTPSAQRAGLPGPGEASTGSMALLELLRRGGRPRLLLPIAGDVRGFPPGSPALVPALDAGAAVVLPLNHIAVVPADGHWRVFELPAGGLPALPTLFDAERDLDAAITAATGQLSRMNVARGANGARERIAELMQSGAVTVPTGTSKAHRHGSMLLAKVVSLEALLGVAAGHQTAAVSRYELASVDDALRPLADAVRAGRLAAVGELIDDIEASSVGTGPRDSSPTRVTAERDHGDPLN